MGYTELGPPTDALEEPGIPRGVPAKDAQPESDHGKRQNPNQGTVFTLNEARPACDYSAVLYQD